MHALSAANPLQTAYRLPIRRACKEVPLLAVDGYSPVGAAARAMESSRTLPQRARGARSQPRASTGCELAVNNRRHAKDWKRKTIKHQAPLRPRQLVTRPEHGQSTASSVRNPGTRLTVSAGHILRAALSGIIWPPFVEVPQKVPEASSPREPLVFGALATPHTSRRTPSQAPS